MAETKLIDGKALAKREYVALKERVARLSRPPSLMILASEGAAQSAYIRAKQRVGERIGTDVIIKTFLDDVSATHLSDIVNASARESAFDGVVIQLPLPEHLDGNRNGILRILPEDRDVDCLSERWLGRLVSGRIELTLKRGSAILLPPVVGAIKTILEAEAIDVSGKYVTVVGWGDLVGKPVALWFMTQGATVTVATRQTKDLSAVTRGAEIIVLGAGQPGVLTGDMVQEGVVVLDAGTSDDQGTLKGDAAESVYERASVLTPVPGGIGPLTIAMLYRNLVSLAEARQQ